MDKTQPTPEQLCAKELSEVLAKYDFVLSVSSEPRINLVRKPEPKESEPKAEEPAKSEEPAEAPSAE